MLGQGEGKEAHDQERQQKERRQLAARAEQCALVHCLFALVVMPLDGEEHAGAEYEHFEGNEDYRGPIYHFENFQPMA